MFIVAVSNKYKKYFRIPIGCPVTYATSGVLLETLHFMLKCCNKLSGTRLGDDNVLECLIPNMFEAVVDVLHQFASLSQQIYWKMFYG